MAVVAGQLWLRWNAFVHGNKINSSVTVIGGVVELLEAYQAVNSRKEGVVLKENIRDFRWEASNNDFVKVNWDAAVDECRGKNGRWVSM